MSKMRESFFFEKLIIYQRSLAFSVKVCRLASNFPVKYQRIQNQLIGAAISVPLNIAEGSGRKFAKEKINFCNTARASLFECVPLFEICKSLKLVEARDFEELVNESVEISKMINGYTASIR